MEKRCFRCLQTKVVDDFYAHSAMRDGRLNKCIDCTKGDMRAYRLANLERIRAYDIRRAALPHRIAMTARVYAKWKAQHPDRRAAQVLVGNALRAGKLTRWPCCAVPECDRKPEAHHPDYSAPLAVSWLCRPHHMQAHAINDELEAA
jgi:hypothetical protein